MDAIKRCRARLTDTYPARTIYMPARRRTRATSSRNPGRHHLGMPGRLRRNPHVTACAAAEIAPLLAPGPTPHHPTLEERFAVPAPENPTPLEAMLHCLAMPEGKKLYAQRKHIPEPVFGIIKSVLGFRQFL